MSADKMTSRERLLAAINQQPVDYVPFAPLTDGYFLSGQPPKDYGFMGHKLLIENGIDALVRHVIVFQHSAPLLGVNVSRMNNPRIEKKVERDGRHTTVILESKVGTLVEKMETTDTSQFIPWVSERRLKTVDDVKTMLYMLETAEIGPLPGFWDAIAASVGDDGLATTSGPTSPLEMLINGEAGLESTVVLMHEHEEETEELLEALHQHNLEAYARIAESDAEVVIAYENLSSTLISPTWYEKYDRRYTNDYADIIHDAGKIFLTHMCGTLSIFGPQFAEARQDGIADIAPEPTGDVDFVEAKRTWGKDWVLTGGIDATMLRHGTPEQVYKYSKKLLEELGKDARGFILGSGDATPHGTIMENLLAALRACKENSVT